MAGIKPAQKEQSGIGNLINVGKTIYGAATGNVGMMAGGAAGLTKNGAIGGIVNAASNFGAFDSAQPDATPASSDGLGAGGPALETEFDPTNNSVMRRLTQSRLGGGNTGGINI